MKSLFQKIFRHYSRRRAAKAIFRMVFSAVFKINRGTEIQILYPLGTEFLVFFAVNSQKQRKKQSFLKKLLTNRRLFCYYVGLS
jgi:hypothetical protein